MATVAFFLEAYDDTPDFDVLNRIICQWRKAEDLTRAECGLPSVTSEYPGCFFYQRGVNDDITSPAKTVAKGDRQLRERKRERTQRLTSVHDVIAHNLLHDFNNESFTLKKIIMEEEDFTYDDKNFDWDAFIQEVYDQEQLRHQTSRHLVDYQHVGPWFNYFPLIACKTEYYYRYSGTQTVPPCYGRVSCLLIVSIDILSLSHLLIFLFSLP